MMASWFSRLSWKKHGETTWISALEMGSREPSAIGSHDRMHFKANSLRGANYISGSSSISNFVDAYININVIICIYMILYVSMNTICTAHACARVHKASAASSRTMGLIIVKVLVIHAELGKAMNKKTWKTHRKISNLYWTWGLWVISGDSMAVFRGF